MLHNIINTTMVYYYYASSMTYRHASYQDAILRGASVACQTCFTADRRKLRSKILRWPQWHKIHTKIHKILSSGSRVGTCWQKYGKTYTMTHTCHACRAINVVLSRLKWTWHVERMGTKNCLRGLVAILLEKSLRRRTLYLRETIL
jgi:hypothetical protein